LTACVVNRGQHMVSNSRPLNLYVNSPNQLPSYRSDLRLRAMQRVVCSTAHRAIWPIRISKPRPGARVLIATLRR